MTIEEFRNSDGQSHPAMLRALWLADRGDWDQAHEIAQADDSREGAWVHAYLHRAEGDSSNAQYWYRRDGRSAPSGDLESEWQAIVIELLQRAD